MASPPNLSDDLLGRLPAVYAEVLRLRSQGADDQSLAAAAGVSADAVGLLVEVAERKLRRLSPLS